MLHRILLCAGLGLAIASPAAASVYTPRILNGSSGIGSCGEFGSTTTSGPNAATVTLNDGGLNCTVSGSAYAGPGALGFRATSTYNGDIGPAGLAPIQGGGNARMTGIYLTPLFDPTDPEALEEFGYQSTVTVNAYLEGVGTSDATGNASAGNGIKATVGISGAFDYGSQLSDSVDAFGGSGVSGNSGGEPFDNFSTSMTPSILQRLDIPFIVTFNMDINVNSGTSGGGIASSTLDAFSSLSFSKTGPAFILDEGFTVHAPELNIFNNRWIDPRASVVTPSAVPLPASFLLLLGGLGTFARMRSRSTAPRI